MIIEIVRLYKYLEADFIKVEIQAEKLNSVLEWLAMHITNMKKRINKLAAVGM